MSLARTSARRLLVLVTVTASSVAALVVPAAATGPAYQLSPRQEAVVLDLIDDVCGDTWCEGDHAFDFRRFTCDPLARACTLTLRTARYDGAVLHWRWRTRQVHGFPRFGHMVSTAPTGQHSLRSGFYGAVTEVIRDVEASVPTRPAV